MLSFMPPPEPSGAPAPAPQNPALGAPVQLPAVAKGPAPKGEFRSQSGGVWSTALSRDGALLATGLENGRISVWDVQKEQLKFDLRHEAAGKDSAHTGIVWTVEFTSTPDGEKLVSAGDDGMVKTWDVATGKLDNSLELGRSIRAAAVSASTNLIAIGDAHGQVQVFDLEHDTPIHTYLQSGSVNGVAFSSDGTSVASVASDGTIVVSDIPTNRRRYTLKGHTGPVYGVAFSADGDRLVTTGWDRTAIVWDMRDGTQMKKLGGHDGGVWTAQFTPCGRILATVGQDGKTRIWDADSGELLETFGRHLGMIHTVRFDRTGSMLVTGGRDGSVFVWDAGHCKKK
jgi:eukaryotic-like serine/threonine-protein kinase